MGLVSNVKVSSAQFCNDKNLHPKKFVITCDLSGRLQTLLVPHDTFDADPIFRKYVTSIKYMSCPFEEALTAWKKKGSLINAMVILIQKMV